MLRRSLALLLFALAACESSKPPAPPDLAKEGVSCGVMPDGPKIFVKYACSSCHSIDGSLMGGPTMKGLLGSKRTLRDGTVVVADEAYVRESILKPDAKVVYGYPAVMPSFKGQLSDDQIDSLIAYFKTLR